MNNEQRKQYNKDYYIKNKEKILKNALTKQTCKFCNRSIIKNNMHIHQSLNICKRTADHNALLKKRKEDTKIFVNELQILMTDNSKPNIIDSKDMDQENENII